MFGITPLGWLHTLGSLPAIPAAAYMIFRFGRIKPDSVPGYIYFVCMLVGSLTIFLVAKAPISPAIAIVTMLCLFGGYAANRYAFLGRLRKYIETSFLSLTVFLLMVPSVSETLRRVPDGHPFVTDPNSVVLKGAVGLIAAVFVSGLAAQIYCLARYGDRAR
ncbi:hypothetical protein C8J36_1089 [Rhizobium sp. PP-F2F-G48]|uniref:hypothetical protein n=1 Tax=Rhizobium sp. PP-F2F-G48 TaxID=2135651 RepID=UPI0010446340|nr:hypothetical protein [Rhizobium sp. PP-F2F-G48]TCM52565.1 hypothetical protein C8J36_1089 [Rhizobium sp. PP-F2F-G48]